MQFTASFKKRLNHLSRVPIYVVTLLAIYLITLSGTAVISYRNLQTLRQDNDWTGRAWEVKRQLKNINIAIVGLESDVRGYLISGDVTYLNAWQAASLRLAGSFDRLEQLVQDSPAQSNNLRQLRSLYGRKFDELAADISLYQGTARPAFAMRDGMARGREVMTLIVTLNTVMQSYESESIESRRVHYFHESNEAMWINIMINGLAMLILILFYRLINIGVVRQRQVEDQLKATNDNLETIVQLRTQQLSVLSRHLLNVREEEKAKLARELHDELGASLTAIGMDISNVREKLQEIEPRLARQLARAKQTLVDTIDLKRRIIENLRPSMLDNLGLAASIRHHCDELSRISGLRYELEIAEEFDDIDPARAIALFRITQEALNNVLKYARANLVKIGLTRLEAGLQLKIEDDGVGISREVLDKPISHGLLGMRERTLLLGGRFSIHAGSGDRGCAIEVFLPHSSRSQVAAQFST